MGGIGGGGPRLDAQPYDNRTETSLPVLSRCRVGEEAGWADGGAGYLLNLDKFNNLGTDRLPDRIERGTIDPAYRLNRDMAVSADRLGERGSAEIGSVDKYVQGGRRPR